MSREKPIPLPRAVQKAYPEIGEPTQAVVEGRVRVDGLVKTNPATMVRPSAKIVLDWHDTLRGTTKLQPALARFPVTVDGVTAVDAGAAAGGFTVALLQAGAAKVYAVDVGFGQIIGTLRQDRRVVVYEKTNIADLTTELVPEPVDLVVVDLSYLSLGSALPQLNRIDYAPAAELIALVKPMFELRLASAPSDEPSLMAALEAATVGATEAGWDVVDWMHSPQRGSKGAAELVIFGRRSTSVSS